MQNQTPETCWHNRKVNVKGKGCPDTCQASTVGRRVSLEWEWVVPATSRTLCPWKREGGIRCIGGWESLGAGPDESRKTYPTGVRTPDRPARSESLHREFYNTENKYYSCKLGRDLRKIISSKKSKSDGIWRCHSHFTNETTLKNEVKTSGPTTENCRRDSVIGIVSRIQAELPVFDSRQGWQSSLFPTTSRPAPRCIRPPTKWVSGVLSPGTSGRRVKWTTHLQQMSKLRMCESVTLLPTLRLHGAQRDNYTFPFFSIITTAYAGCYTIRSTFYFCNNRRINLPTSWSSTNLRPYRTPYVPCSLISISQG